jgi:hypothetical protein
MMVIKLIIRVCCFIICLQVVPVLPANADEIADGLAIELAAKFDALLIKPEDFQRKVRQECKRFPEGDLFPYLLPALAYGHLADRTDEAERGPLLAKMAQLIELARPGVEKKTRAPDRDLMKLESYRGEGVYVCQLNMALSAYRMLGGKRFGDLNDHLSRQIRNALRKRKGAPLKSFATATWPFDTIPCLVSLAWHDRVTGSADSTVVIENHLEWVAKNGTEKATGLPFSRIEKGPQRPRGCDLSWRVALLAQIAPDRAKKLYRRYVKHFWLERFVAAGFAEWAGGSKGQRNNKLCVLGEDRAAKSRRTDAGIPEGTSRRRNTEIVVRDRLKRASNFCAGSKGKTDHDSGPVFWGIGSAASVLGLAAARAAGDDYRFARIIAQVDKARAAIRELLVRNASADRVLLGGMIPISKGYVTGFLYGDAVLFYAVTYRVIAR